MSKEPLFVAVSNQKGGVGKSALTVVLSSYLHFEKNLNVAIIDCDSPQHSLVRMRERDKKAAANNAYYQQAVEPAMGACKEESLSYCRSHCGKSERGGGRALPQTEIMT